MHRTTLAVLEAFLDAGPLTRLYGLEIMRLADIKSGTLYPILERLEEAGWISGEWGDDSSGPRRRYYTLTGEGAREASAAVLKRWQSTKLRPGLA